MIKSIVIYLLLLISAFVFNIFYFGWFSWFLLVLTIAVPLVSLLFSLPFMITGAVNGVLVFTHDSIKIGDETYYTKQISVNDTSGFTFTVNAAKGTKIILTPKWGSYSGNADLNSGETIGITAVNTQQETSPMAAASTTEPTTTTTSATPSSTPAESATTAPEPSETAPTQPESTDTEPSSAPETATPENTTAAQTEPPTTEESESN